jgi:hypothetical protein
MKRSMILFFFLTVSMAIVQGQVKKPAFHIAEAPAPLFRDPVFDGAADPTAIWDPAKGEWLIFYTQRRARLDLPGVAWCYGTAIGIAGSKDGGRTWTYRGTAALPAPDSATPTFWAPQVFRASKSGEYRMVVTHIAGVFDDWGGRRVLRQYASKDLQHWRDLGPVGLNGCIDASVFQMPNGMWKMWFKDETKQSFTYASVSSDLAHWTRLDSPEVRNRHHEGPVVFRWKGAYWMITDPTYDEYTGLDVFRSDDLTHWAFNNTILNSPGMRPDDNDQGRHADVQVVDGKAILLYFTHPGRTYPNHGPEDPDEGRYRYRRSSLQAAELEMREGKVICDRDKYWPGRKDK